ncbi:Vps72p NDAI_0A07040 [Naumovozyma dairenensis CBS 421]|uniref:Vps72/YL1 C-terminal domain-containing protein n=1 Tax=Naumovozyma dairenensis (strain ATCC 10597 / BCRC 20456 / CBS 421 / NBRC 0211 / NRRL Y-12639) TaxID=1071378 RepID=G0W4X0_NAUDC|nr:hypothetical protein NDAI_0A07040 [Naumovozyma dairenensis CBS 421]CCD22858.1 hypothetical protein NDAI_0A07040 [Naumovozyma dairenensis CBS 421]
MSDHEDDINQEFLITTRKRRSNAGNKLKSLLEQELQDLQIKTQQFDEDEIDLLFQEDADDEDFEARLQQEEEDTEQSEEGEHEGQKKSSKQSEKSTDYEEDEDLMLSESEDEEIEGSNNEDNEAGEKELQLQERLRKKKRISKQRAPPVIVRKRQIKPVSGEDEVLTIKKKRPSYDYINAETLLHTDRRTSKRSSVVANKLQVYAKLSKAEERRKEIQERIKKHKEAQKHHILTQEDRMRIALETEKSNILSLDKYKQQEITKKQSRLAMQQRQKMKFTPEDVILRTVSTSWIVTPNMEIDDKQYWDDQLQRRDKKKKKYPRRQTKKRIQKIEEQNLTPTTSETTAHSSNNGITEIKNEDASENAEGSVFIEEAKENQTSLGNGDSSPKNEEMMTEQFSGPDSNNKEKSIESIAAPVHNKNNPIPDREVSPDISHEISKDLSLEMAMTKAIRSDSSQDSSSMKEINDDLPNTHVIDENKEDTSALSPHSLRGHDENKPTNVEALKAPSKEHSVVEASDITKQVSFASTPEIAIISRDDPTLLVKSSKETTPIEEVPKELESDDIVVATSETSIEDEIIYEGPNQLVSKEFVTLYKTTTEYTGDLYTTLFGKPVNSSEKSLNVETILKSTLSENDETDGIKPQVFWMNTDLSILDKFPAFGEYDKKISHEITVQTDNSKEIILKTAPPAGIYLPSGMRKKCLITNKDCQYFDPKNGIPYSDLEAYKIIQELQEPETGSYKWFGFKNGGIYLNTKQTPAKGVPEGF